MCANLPLTPARGRLTSAPAQPGEGGVDDRVGVRGGERPALGPAVGDRPQIRSAATSRSRSGASSPARLLLGSMIYDLAFDVSRRRMATWSGWEEVSRAAEHAVPAP